MNLCASLDIVLLLILITVFPIGIDANTHLESPREKQDTKANILLSTKQRLTVQNYILVWLNPTANENETDQAAIVRLRPIFNAIYRFIDEDRCIDFIEKIKDEKVFLILSKHLLPSTLLTIHNRSQIYSIYMITENTVGNELLTEQWPKIRGIYRRIDHCFNILKQDAEQCDRDSISFSVTNGKNLDRLNSMFTYTCLLKKMLIETKNNPTIRKELVAFSRIQYLNNTNELKKIDAFERNYRLDTAIWWYTQRCFLYQMLNRALRTHDIEVLLKMGFFLRDLQQQIDELRSNTARHNNLVLIYRGQGMSNVDLERIKRTRKGDLFVFNNFFTATLNKKVALEYARNALSNPDTIGVLFNITINASATSSAPFVSRRQVDALANEKEGILFTINPIFRITDLKPLEKRLWEIELIVIQDGDPQLTQIRERIRKESSKSNRWQRMGDLLIRMRHYDKAEDVYQFLLQSSSNVDSETLPYIYNQLGRIKDKQHSYMEAIAFHMKALEIQQKYFSSNHLDMIHTYNHLGTVYNDMGEYSTALDFYRKTLDIQQDLFPANHQNFITTYKNFGSVYQNMREYTLALEYYQKVLHIQEQSLPSNHTDFITTYINIASIYHNMSEYANAILFFDKVLKIYQKSFPSNYPYFVVLYQNIGTVYQDMGHFSKALKYFQKVLKIQQQSIPSDNPVLVATYHTIASTYYQMKEYSKALDLFNKILQIQQKSLPPDHPDLAITYDFIGLIHQQLKQGTTAVSFFERAIDIVQRSQPENQANLELYQKHLQNLKDEL